MADAITFLTILELPGLLSVVIVVLDRSIHREGFFSFFSLLTFTCLCWTIILSCCRLLFLRSKSQRSGIRECVYRSEYYIALLFGLALETLVGFIYSVSAADSTLYSATDVSGLLHTT
jgi:hypothetical protein